MGFNHFKWLCRAIMISLSSYTTFTFICWHFGLWIALTGASFRISRKLSSSAEAYDEIFLKIDTIVALWVYIKPCEFCSEISNSFFSKGKKVENADWCPYGASILRPGVSFRTCGLMPQLFRIVVFTLLCHIKTLYKSFRLYTNLFFSLKK